MVVNLVLIALSRSPEKDGIFGVFLQGLAVYCGSFEPIACTAPLNFYDTRHSIFGSYGLIPSSGDQYNRAYLLCILYFLDLSGSGHPTYQKL